MKDNRVESNVSDERIRMFHSLIRFWEAKGNQKDSAIQLDKNLKLSDGSHRIAMALYYGDEE